MVSPVGVCSGRRRSVAGVEVTRCLAVFNRCLEGD